MSIQERRKEAERAGDEDPRRDSDPSHGQAATPVSDPRRPDPDGGPDTQVTLDKVLARGTTEHPPGSTSRGEARIPDGDDHMHPGTRALPVDSKIF